MSQSTKFVSTEPKPSSGPNSRVRMGESVIGVVREENKDNSQSETTNQEVSSAY